MRPNFSLICPSDLTPDAKGARWRSNLHCDARGAARVVPHYALYERDRGSRGRPIGIIDEAVDPNVRPRSNIEYGLIEETQICASLDVGIHQIVLRDRCATSTGAVFLKAPGLTEVVRPMVCAEADPYAAIPIAHPIQNAFCS